MFGTGRPQPSAVRKTAAFSSTRPLLRIARGGSGRRSFCLKHLSSLIAKFSRPTFIGRSGVPLQMMLLQVSRMWTTGVYMRLANWKAVDLAVTAELDEPLIVSYTSALKCREM